MANQETGTEVEGTDHLKEYKRDINDIIKDGLFLGILGLYFLMISSDTVLLRPNPFGIIANSSCIPGSDVIVNLKYSFAISICASWLAAVLAICLKLTLCFTSSLHEIVICVWVFISAAIALVGHVFFYITMVDRMQVMLGSVSCATNSTSFLLAVAFGVLLSLIIALFIMTRFSVSFGLAVVLGAVLSSAIFIFILIRISAIFVLAVVLGAVLSLVIIFFVISRFSVPH